MIKQHTASGMVNDPNQRSDDPRYIVALVNRVIQVSMETLAIVASLPELELDQAIDQAAGSS